MFPPAMECVYNGENNRRINGSADKRMANPAMVSECGNRAFEAPENIDVGKFCGQGQHERRIAGAAVKSRASHACAREQVSDWFHYGTEDNLNCGTGALACAAATSKTQLEAAMAQKNQLGYISEAPGCHLYCRPFQ